MNNQNLIKLLNKNLSINGMITIKKLAWSWEKDIAKKQENILRKHCDVKPKPILVNPLTGNIELVYLDFKYKKD